MPRSAWLAWPLLAVIALGGCAPVQAPPPAPPTPAPPPKAAPPPAQPPAANSDQQFIDLALGMGAGEIGMGRLAHGKARAREIRLFAEHIVAGQTVADRRLLALARHLKIEASPARDQPPPELITSAGGPGFDKQYLALVVEAHQDMIALFENEAESGQEPRLRHYAKSALPALRLQQQRAEAIAQKLGL